MQEPLLLSIQDAAKALGLSKNFVYLEAKRGNIPTVRYGKRLLVPAEELKKLVADMIGNNR
jgi:excisionase family DNA binding protein